MKTIPIVIALLTVVGLGAIAGFSAYNESQIQPKDHCGETGVIYTETSTAPYEGLCLAIEATRSIVEAFFPKNAAKVMDFWVAVHGDGPITGRFVSGRADPRRITGTVDWLPGFLWRRHRVIRIRQLGSDAGRSALFHEVAEHLIPYETEGTWNAAHDPHWRLLTEVMRDRYLDARR